MCFVAVNAMMPVYATMSSVALTAFKALLSFIQPLCYEKRD